MPCAHRRQHVDSYASFSLYFCNSLRFSIEAVLRFRSVIESAGCATPCLEVKFDALKPRLWACNLSVADVARVFVRSAVHDRMLPLITKGEAGSEQMKTLCAALKALCEAAPAEGDAILIGGTTEVLELAVLFTTLLSDSAHEDPEALQRIDAIMAPGSKSNASNWVQKGVQQQPWYKARESSLRKRFLAFKSMAPELRDAIPRLDGSITKDLPDMKAWPSPFFIVTLYLVPPQERRSSKSCVSEIPSGPEFVESFQPSPSGAKRL